MHHSDTLALSRKKIGQPFDWSLAVTGAARPEPDRGKPPGPVHVAACLRGKPAVARELTFPGDDSADA